jgi:two-component system LytT family response regulator
VHTAGRNYLLRRTLQDLLSQLGEQRFARIHKSTAVNLGSIGSLTPLFKGDYEIHLHNGRVLRLSRRYREALFARMGQ